MKMDIAKTDIAQEYHKILYKSINWRKDLSWRGVKILKNPNDLFLSQMLINELRPNTIIETGTAWGGSALFYHDIMSYYTTPNVISIDNRTSRGTYIPSDYVLPEENGIIYITDDSIKSAKAASQLKYGTTLIFLDSDHHWQHVLGEMQVYGPLVTVGSYLVVEDANTHIVLPDYDDGRGPAAAVRMFMDSKNKYDGFTINHKLASWFGFSFNIWMRRI